MLRALSLLLLEFFSSLKIFLLAVKVSKIVISPDFGLRSSAHYGVEVKPHLAYQTKFALWFLKPDSLISRYPFFSLTSIYGNQLMAFLFYYSTIFSKRTNRMRAVMIGSAGFPGSQLQFQSFFTGFSHNQTQKPKERRRLKHSPTDEP
jgi:hypothetical protein